MEKLKKKVEMERIKTKMMMKMMMVIITVTMAILTMTIMTVLTLATGKIAAITQNQYDVKECDVTLAYLPKSISDRRCSYGTICEIAWAHAQNKPVVIVSDDPYVHDHPVIQEIGVHFSELNAAVGYINQLLTQHV